MCTASYLSHHQHHRLSGMGPPTTYYIVLHSQYTKVHVGKNWSGENPYFVFAKISI